MKPAHCLSKDLRRAGFTLVELLVVIAIIAILVMTLLPAISVVREMSRRNLCEQRGVQLNFALQEYELSNSHFPPGVMDDVGPIESRAMGRHQGWIGQLLPQLGRSNLADALVADASVYDEANAELRAHRLVAVMCPSDYMESPVPASNFAGVHHDVEASIDADNHGILFLNSQVRLSDIEDGAEFTLLFGEKLRDYDDLGWLSGTRATLRNTGTPIGVTAVQFAPRAKPLTTTALAEQNQDPDEDPPWLVQQATPLDPLYVGGFSSAHAAGANMGFADGSVRFLNRDIDPQVLQHLGHRSDGSLPDESVLE